MTNHNDAWLITFVNHPGWFFADPRACKTPYTSDLNKAYHFQTFEELQRRGPPEGADRIAVQRREIVEGEIYAEPPKELNPGVKTVFADPNDPGMFFDTIEFTTTTPDVTRAVSITDISLDGFDSDVVDCAIKRSIIISIRALEWMGYDLNRKSDKTTDQCEG